MSKNKIDEMFDPIIETINHLRNEADGLIFGLHDLESEILEVVEKLIKETLPIPDFKEVE